MESDYRELERVVFLNAFQDRSMERTRLVQGSVTLLNPRSITGNTCLINSNEAVIMSWKRYAEESSSISIKNSVVDNIFSIYFFAISQEGFHKSLLFLKVTENNSCLFVVGWSGIWSTWTISTWTSTVNGCSKYFSKLFFFFSRNPFYIHFFQLLRFLADTVAREF